MLQQRNVTLAVVCPALALILLAALPAAAQTLKGTLLGTISDSSHAVVPDVQVSLTETNTNFHLVQKTNESGFYVFANLDPGAYKVEVEHPGFRKILRSGVDLTPNSTVRVDLDLTPGQVTEVIDVTADIAVLQTDRADTGAKVETKQLETFPLLNNRNYQNLLMLAPGVQRSYRSNSAFYNSQEHLQSVVNGLDQRNNYMIEGSMTLPWLNRRKHDSEISESQTVVAERQAEFEAASIYFHRSLHLPRIRDPWLDRAAPSEKEWSPAQNMPAEAKRGQKRSPGRASI